MRVVGSSLATLNTDCPVLNGDGFDPDESE
jgi:hypothetical protein